MYVYVDLSSQPPTVTLEEPQDCGRFHVAARGGRSEPGLAAALVAAGVGRGAGDGHAAVAVDAVRRLAGGRVGPTWDADFEAMLSYASGKGWLSPDGNAITAHVEWT